MSDRQEALNFYIKYIDQHEKEIDKLLKKNKEKGLTQFEIFHYKETKYELERARKEILLFQN